MSESREIKTLRAIAWEKAKGELSAYLQTFWPEYTLKNEEVDRGYELAKTKIRDFIKDFEDCCR